MQKARYFLFLLLAMALSVAGGVGMAQGGVLNYGDTQMHQISAESPQALFSFNGNADEVVTVYALGWIESFQPTLTVLGPTGQLAFSNDDALTPMGNDARATVKLPAAGAYSILVGSTTGSAGEFTIALRLTTPGISTALSDAPVTLTIPPGGDKQTYSISGSPEGTTSLQIASNTVDFGVAGYVSAPDGQILMAFDGALPSVNITLPVNNTGMPYILVIHAADETQSGEVTIQAGGSGDSTSTTPDTSTSTTTDQTTDSQNQPPADQCAAVAGDGGLNVRSGPSTDYQVLTTIAPNGYLIVNGQNNGWYSGPISGGATGWVAGSVITLVGPCSNLAFVEAPAAPSQQPTTAPQQPTQTQQTGDTSPTATTPPPDTNQPTATPTATQAQQVAPPDSDYNLTIDRDDGGQMSEVISYPNGDTTDRVRVTISNLTNFTPNNTRNVVLTLVCTGTGTENVRWGTGGPSSPTPRTCGESITSFHTDDSNQTFVNITLTGNGYVTWTLVATTN